MSFNVLPNGKTEEIELLNRSKYLILEFYRFGSLAINLLDLI